MQVKLKITQEHMDLGCRHDGNNCAAARALIDAVPGIVPLSVYVDHVRFLFVLGTGAEFRAATPDTLAEWIAAYDAGPAACERDGVVCEPAEFDLVFSEVVP